MRPDERLLEHPDAGATLVFTRSGHARDDDVLHVPGAGIGFREVVERDRLVTDLELTVTRRQLLRRAAAGGTILTLPGLLAACGGSSSSKKATGSSGGKKQLAKTLYFSNWPLYIDINEKTKTHPSLAQFTKHALSARLRMPFGRGLGVQNEPESLIARVCSSDTS